MPRASAPSPTESGAVDRRRRAGGPGFRLCQPREWIRVARRKCAVLRSTAHSCCAFSASAQRRLRWRHSPTLSLGAVLWFNSLRARRATARPLLKALPRPMASDSLEATEERTCTDCRARAPSTETNYTLISASHGWRLASRPRGAGEKPVLEWRCPTCWAAYRMAGGKLRPTP
jgi:hypothetical protein